ncbi:hypothetical protein [uncultured Cetobacterium sp.]|nr:hypothetical protein [uncultured Cetobacterium sp.]
MENYKDLEKDEFKDIKKKESPDKDGDIYISDFPKNDYMKG